MADRTGADPIAVGRSVVVGAGATSPGPWASCERVRVTAIDRALADHLGAAWRERRSLVIELTSGLGLDDPDRPPAEVVKGQPWEWSVDLDLVGERLHHAIWANALDGRHGEPTWRWGEVARGLGARPATAGGDVVLLDGSVAICDGGPLDAGLADRIGLPVVHWIALEQGSLRPLGRNVPVGLELAGDQQAAVAEPGGGARIIAPAGSGKTRVLTERARLLIEGWGLPPAAMALVAYNTRAADEMADRLAGVGEVRVRTLNALGYRLCGRRTTIVESEVRDRLGALVAVPRRAETDPLAPWIEALSRVRLGLAHPSSVEDELPDVSDLEQVVLRYRERLTDDDVVDFDEQPTLAVERLLGDPAFRQRAQRAARVLLVDEFQDLCPVHLLLIRLLTGPAGVVFGVGDDDQTIYGYAGATPRWLVDFERWFPGAATHPLEVNYRCPSRVVSAVSNLLTRNAVRVPKSIRAARSDEDSADALSVLDGEGGPATRAADRVAALLDDGVATGDIAVLARVNASLAPVQVLLRNRGIPVQREHGEQFLRRGSVRAVLAWLELATAGDEALSGPALADAARRPKRGMSHSLLNLVGRQHSVGELRSLAGWLAAKDSDREAEKIQALADDVARVRAIGERGTTGRLLDVVRTGVGEGGLDATATALDRWAQGAGSSHGDDLDALSELAELEPDPRRFPAWISEHLRRPSDPDGVTLASIHAVKGREWPHVVVYHATDGLLPHRLSDDAEEERRLFHVALTRCRVSASVVPGSPPSPFLDELDAAGSPPPVQVPSPPRPATTRQEAPAEAPVETQPVSVGLQFSHRGHDYEVTEVSSEGARALVGGGPAFVTVAFGESVSVQGRSVMLAHPRFEEAWERLRAWRRERADGKPAFVVFGDRTLRDIALALPTTEAGLSAIRGVGPAKLELYGDELIELAEEIRG